MPKLQDLIGREFDNLTVSERAGIANDGHILWRCDCVCGKVHITSSSKLTSGHTRSCGCIRKRVGRQNNKWRGYEAISKTFWNTIHYNAKIRRLDFDITIEYVWCLYIQQNRKCALSGIPIQFPKTSARRKNNGAIASLDRIDSTKGYVEGNVQWVHKDVNYMKQSFDEIYFVEMCRKIVNLNRKKKRDAEQ